MRFFFRENLSDPAHRLSANEQTNGAWLLAEPCCFISAKRMPGDLRLLLALLRSAHLGQFANITTPE
jgi:hypothetical protein